MSQPIYSVYIKPPEISTFPEKLIQYKYWLAVNWALLTCSRTVLYCLNWWNLFSLLNLISFGLPLDEMPFVRLLLLLPLPWSHPLHSAGVLGQPQNFAEGRQQTHSVFYKEGLAQHQSYPPINTWSTPAPTQQFPLSLVLRSASSKAGEGCEPFYGVYEKQTDYQELKFSLWQSITFTGRWWQVFF